MLRIKLRSLSPPGYRAYLCATSQDYEAELEISHISTTEIFIYNLHIITATAQLAIPQLASTRKDEGSLGYCSFVSRALAGSSLCGLLYSSQGTQSPADYPVISQLIPRLNAGIHSLPPGTAPARQV